MRIISKFPDFYDSFGYIMGEPDNYMTYIREPKTIGNRDNVENGKYQKALDYLSNFSLRTLYFRKYSKKTKYNAILTHVVVGIYPYVYIVPFYILDKTTNVTIKDLALRDTKPIPVNPNDIINNKNKEVYHQMCLDAFDEYCREHGFKTPALDIIGASGVNFNQSKFENRDIFAQLNAPTFIYYAKEWTWRFNIIGDTVTVNPIFTQLPFNVFGTFSDEIYGERNVYIDIENFLWSIKQEPEHVPDNKTKIINHGFDVKTSFRNIK